MRERYFGLAGRLKQVVEFIVGGPMRNAAGVLESGRMQPCE
jgi:hypothetical protein